MTGSIIEDGESRILLKKLKKLNNNNANMILSVSSLRIIDLFTSPGANSNLTGPYFTFYNTFYLY